MENNPASQPVQPLFTMYSTTWCGHCLQTKRWLTKNGFQTGVHFVDIDIEQNPDVCKTVEACNNGNRSVPTLVFPDGSTLTEPTDDQLSAKLGSQKPLQT